MGGLQKRGCKQYWLASCSIFSSMRKLYLFHKKIFFTLLTLVIIVSGGVYFADYNILQGEAIVQSDIDSCNSKSQVYNMSVHFKNIENDKIRACFEKVWKRYEPLHRYEITLVQQSIGGSTMEAQPIITLRSIFNGVKRYRINIGEHIRDEKSLKLRNLPEEILTGWFAHELGHLMDYQQHSNVQMIWYGTKYYFSHDFKKTVEHAADYIAIANGFHEEILATKHFILGDKRISPNYKSKIKRYYLPENEVMLCSEDKDFLKPYYNL